MLANIVIPSHGHVPQAKEGNRCYVALGHGPSVVARCVLDGRYPDAEPEILSGLSVRFGAWGDPCAAPFPLTRRVARVASGWTGYTHAWRTCPPSFRQYLMASVETAKDAKRAQSMGWRTFRHGPGALPVAGEITCPNETHGVQCADCLLCNGNGARRYDRADVPRDTTGAVIWRGASRFNGAPIVVAVAFHGSNGKTGRMAQVYYLPESDLPPMAARTGADASVCGDCPLRPLQLRVADQ